MWNSSTCDCERNNSCKIYEYLDTKNCSCEKCLVSKLVLECEDEILNTTQTLFNDKKVVFAKSNSFIHTISLTIICLLLLFVISVSCYIYYTKYRSKHLGLAIHNNIKIEKIVIKNIL